MRDLILLFVHVFTTLIRLGRPRGCAIGPRRIHSAQTSTADSESFFSARSKSSGIGPADCRIVYAACSANTTRSFGNRSQTINSVEFSSRSGSPEIPAAVFHETQNETRPERSGSELIRAVVEMKQRNPGWGCPRIAEQIALAFGVPINKDVVRRILAMHYQPPTDGAGPSWLTFLGHMKDCLWSTDLFRCESMTLRTYWVLVVMDQYSRRIIGFGIQAGIVDGVALCRMFNHAIGKQPIPKYLSSDNDPLYRFHQWQANLRVLGGTELKDSTLCSAVASVCRAPHWDDSSRVFGSRSVLDGRRSGVKVIWLQGLLQ